MPRKGRPRCDEFARACGRRGVPSRTFNTMKLRSPVDEFRNSKACVCARSVADHRWYAVQGITKTLDSIAGSRKRARSQHDMHGSVREDPMAARVHGQPECARVQGRRFQGSATEAAQELHEDFERILEDHGGASFRSEAVDYLYRGGVRGSVYVAFLAYVNGAVPRASHARFLRLSRVGRHMFLRVKTAVVRDDRVRKERVLFMALCGTDYSVTPVGLGIIWLLTDAVANRELFSSWCAQLESSLWAPPDGTREEAREPPDFHCMAVVLAGLTGIPPKIRDTHWSGAKCELMFRTLKYVCDLWALKKPQIGPEYGFSVHNDGVARFLGESREALPSPPSP
ncbi:hypothetical protein Q5P01_017885 [Channa striata]|uniref:Uncharacterized protein n=1 Tax=Channa striata TaxID=64152 RepID=A0AA88M3Y5_CHASR|nr:hypothetical protein Q5P01_017885 [Channa striata]